MREEEEEEEEGEDFFSSARGLVSVFLCLFLCFFSSLFLGSPVPPPTHFLYVYERSWKGSSNKNFRITRKEAHITNSTSLKWQVPFKTNTPAIESEAWNHLCILRFLHCWRLRDVLLLTLAFFGNSKEWLLWIQPSCVDPPNVSGPGSLWGRRRSFQHPLWRKSYM